MVYSLIIAISSSVMAGGRVVDSSAASKATSIATSSVSAAVAATRDAVLNSASTGAKAAARTGSGWRLSGSNRPPRRLLGRTV